MEASEDETGQIPLILINGPWLSAGGGENHADYFAKRGFAVSAPEWLDAPTPAADQAS